MFVKPRQLLVKIAGASSTDPFLPSAVGFIMQIISELQALSVSFTPLVLTSSKHSNAFSRSLITIISYLDPFSLLDPFISQEGIKALVALCICYTLLHVMMIFSGLWLPKSWNKNNRLSQIISLLSLIHSRLVIYPILYFVSRTLNLYTLCRDSSNDSDCEITWFLVLPIIVIVLCIPLAVVKETFCYKVGRSASILAVKDNSYISITLIQKMSCVLLLGLMKDPSASVTLVTVLFNLLRLVLLQTQMPFYDLKMLKMSLLFTTCSSVISVSSIFSVSDLNDNIVTLVLLMMPLIVKLSFLMLRYTTQKILGLQVSTPYQAAHFSILINQFLPVLLSQNGQLKETLYLLGAMKGFKHLKDKEISKRVGLVAIEHLQKILKRQPRNRFLLLSLAQIYINDLEDIPKAISTLNQLKGYTLNICYENSVESLFSEMKDVYDKSNKELEESYMNYFIFKEKALHLKQEIKKELADHQSFWASIQAKAIDAHTTIHHANKITTQSDKIELFWAKNFQGLENLNLNASILYGIYIYLVQGHRNLGLPLVEKAYKALHGNRNASQKEIIDILTGNSAILITSLESEKTGKIMDASASIKQVFGVDKRNLKNSTLDMFLPNMMSGKHNKLLSQYYQESNYDGNKHPTTWAKTALGEYIRVKIVFGIHPSISQGISLIAKIEKDKQDVSLMIVDNKGRVTDCSRKLQETLNLREKEGFHDLNKICPALTDINSHFDMVYKPFATENDDLSLLTDEENVKMDFNEHKENIIVSREQLLNPQDLKSWEGNHGRKESEMSLLRRQTTLAPTKPELMSQESPKHLRLPLKVNNRELEDEAKRICHSFKEGQQLKFYRLPTNKRERPEECMFKVQIEPLIIEQELYKIIQFIELPKLIPSKIGALSPKITHRSKEKYNGLLLQATASPKGKSEEKEEQDEDFNEQLLSPVSMVKSDMRLLTPTSMKETDSQEQKAILEIDKQKENAKLITEKLHQLGPANPVNKAHSIAGSQYSLKAVDRSLMKMFRNERPNSAIRISIFLIYIIFIAALSLTVVDYTVKTKSLSGMHDAVSLIEAVHRRLIATINAWGAVLVVYTRSVGIRPITPVVPIFQEVAKNASLDMLESNNLLRVQIDQFEDPSIVKTFYEKSISLWNPYQNTMLLNSKVDSFIANQILVDSSLLVANYKSSVALLKNVTEVMFSINNTANDYLFAVEKAVTDVETYLKDSNQTNIDLLITVLSLKLLTFIVPFILVIILFRTLIKSFAKLFRGIATIQTHHIDSRIEQVQKLQLFLNKDVEENITFNQDELLIETMKAKTQVGKTSNLQYQAKEITLKGTIKVGLKYLFVAILLSLPIFALFAITFSTAKETFHNLEHISQKILTCARVWAGISMITPDFYFLVIFQNETSFRIRNNDPKIELIKDMDILDKANDVLTSSLSSENNGIDDPFIQDMLYKDLCSHMPSNASNATCYSNTDLNTYGLLGLNSRMYSTAVLLMKQYFPTPTLDKAKALMTALSPLLASMPSTINDGYETLIQYLRDLFNQKADEEAENVAVFLVINIIIVFLGVLLVRIVLIGKLERLDKSAKRVLRVIPHQLIQENKALKFYLSHEFKHEMSDLKYFA